MAVPNTFAAATSAIPLANLDANFAYYDAAYSITGTATSFTGAVTLSTGTANGVPYLNASKVLTSGAVLTFDGTILSSTRFAGALNGTVGATTANTGAFTTLTTSSTVTLNGGTANGVTYLNGSKVLTTGSALKWDLTTLTATGSGSAGEVAIRTGDTASNTSYLTFGTTNYNRAQISVSGSALTEGYMAFTTFTGGSGAEAMRLTSSGLEVKQSQLIGYSSYAGIGTNGLAVAGNVGIGTSSPGDKIHAAAAVAAGLSLQATGTGGSTWRILSTDNSASLGGGYLGFNNGSYRMVLDSSGNLGLGVTPSAWNTAGGAALQVKNASLISYANLDLELSFNSYYDGGASYKYIANGFATRYDQTQAAHVWYTAPSGTAGAAITFTQAMTLDASGNLGVGTTSPAQSWTGGSARVAQLQGGGSQVTVLRVNESSATYGDLQLVSSASAEVAVYNFANGAMRFGTNATERMRLDASGNLLVGQTSGSERLAVTQNGSNDVIRANLGTSGSGLTVVGSGSTMTVGFFVTSSGGAGSITCSGTTTLYNISSDHRLKENIQDAAPASALIDSLQVRQYDWKSDGSHQRYGFVAQELVNVAPEAVHQPADPEEMMAVDYSKLVPMLVKEIQDLRKRLAAAGI